MGRCCLFYAVDDQEVEHFRTCQPGEMASCHVIIARDLASADGDDYLLFGEQWMNKAMSEGTVPRWTMILHVAFSGPEELEQLQDAIAAERKLTADDAVALYHPRLFDDRFEEALAARADQED